MFFSKFLFEVECNYEIYDKEILVVIQALKKWRYFLKGTKILVEIWTDHKNLEYFIIAKKFNNRQAW